MRYLLFTTSHCPKCPAFKIVVTEKVPGAGEVLDEKSADFSALVQQYKVKAAPTLIIFDEKIGEIFRTSDVSDLHEFLAQTCA